MKTPHLYTKKRPLRSVLTREAFVALYHDQERTMKEIAELYETSIPAVYRVQRHYGIPARNYLVTRPGRPPVTQGRIDGEVDPKLVSTLYWSENLSFKDLARRFGVATTTVSHFFHVHDIPIRNKSAARRLAVDVGKLRHVDHSVDIEFFRHWTPKMAWTLGFLFMRAAVIARGLRGFNILTVMDRNRDCVARVRHNLKADHPIRRTRNGPASRWTSHRLSIANVRLVEDLVVRGVAEKRGSRQLTAPVPPQYQRWFLKGVIEAAGGCCPDLAFTASHRSDVLLHQVHAMLRENGLPVDGTVTASGTGRMYALRLPREDGPFLAELMAR